MSKGDSLGPSVWAVSDGRAGNAAQVRAVAQALNETRRWMKIAHIAGEGHRSDALTLTPRAPWVWLPPARWPAPLSALPKAQRAPLTPPWPTIWIGAGRRTAPYSANMRTLSGGVTLCVHILDAKMDPAAFDLLVTPEHDGVSGGNVISTIGSPAYFSEDRIEDAGAQFANLADEPGRKAIVILGGDSKAHTFDRASAERLQAQIKLLAGQGWRMRISASRRTPNEITASFRSFADQIGARFWAGPEDGPNPYLAWLVYSDAAIVTEDSANMLSDAAFHGLPIHIARLKGGAPKFDALHKSLMTRGCARIFDGTLDTWDYPPLREADRVADAIVAELLKRYPQPDIPAIDGKVIAPDWL